ncbi:hypothetical protein PT520_09720 [Aliarcobacter butzleri]|uniref:Lipoprotein n=1 Tax=Aliarcobacter butzleri TaxID=28197 RepID=A0AAW6VRC0_9BACT|nr:hypothetical protein [Aliarcobacter butzleri]MDK2062794.1 hypothetical protein [Aliarcobacter butzleri]
MKKYILLIVFIFFTGCDKKETWGLYKYQNERLVHFEHFADNRKMCIEYASFLNDKYHDGTNTIRCYQE